ncbi:response regulator transcription factor [Paenibacillus sp. A14]|uniref:response regulator transcription factor n=1 Tax=Paenibacillus sp. A14 TaxID=3119820 RepID=UPI002FE16C16
MFSVMIVDDEPKLRLGLQTLIPWKELGYEVTDTAASGKEALRSLEEVVPDLLVVDIRMPGMNGLQLLQEIRQRGWNVHAVVLSGYADFEYARRALQYDVEGYLLKPVNKEEMSALLEKLHARLAAEQLEKQVQRETYTREWLVYSLLSGSFEAEGGALDTLSGSLGMDWPRYQVVMLDFPGIRSEKDERIGRFRERLAKTYASDARSVVLAFASYIVLLLGSPPVGDVERARFYRVLQLLAEELRGEMNAAAGQTVGLLRDIPDSFQTARSLLERSFFYDKGRLLTSETPPSYLTAALGGNLPDKKELAFRIYYLVDVGHTEAIQSLLDGAAAQMVAEGKGEAEIREQFFYLANETSRKVPARLWAESGYAGGPSEFLTGITSQRTLRELVTYVAGILERLARCADYSSRDNEIKRMLDYIERHYNENLKLETLSEVFNYSSSYLGQLFKNQTGEYFNTYLDRVRIEKAKELLAQGMKVYEVAEKAGYSNVNYFHNKFKKMEGQSPSSFQKNGSHENRWRFLK